MDFLSDFNKIKLNKVEATIKDAREKGDNVHIVINGEIHLIENESWRTPMKQEDYKAIAEIINTVEDIDTSRREYHIENPKEEIAIKLAEYFERENQIAIIEQDAQPFDKQQFLKACGIE